MRSARKAYHRLRGLLRRFWWVTITRHKAFCDYCNCPDCLEGCAHGMTHARTVDGKWICDVCWRYDVCVNAKRKLNPSQFGPCEDEWGHAVECEHRPKLAGEWQ